MQIIKARRQRHAVFLFFMLEAKNVVSAGIFRVQNGRWRILYRDKNIEMVGGKMTEREKMLAGMLYDCADRELLTQWP